MQEQLRAATRSLALGLMGLVLAGCAQQGTTVAEAPGRVPVGDEAADPTRSRIVFTALQMVGVPYRYGGSTPEGFDCSGLVQYAYRSAGVGVPRTSREQLRASVAVPFDEASAGDLLFFQSADNSHVGIYLGQGRFVHAPYTGRNVEIGSLADAYYQRNLVRVGRMPGVASLAAASCNDSNGARC
jgi:cell wall-associated NlpC family hydrolase